MNCITEHIYGIDYNTPDIPAYNKITGCTLVTRNQKFRRTEVPQSFEELEYDDDGEPVYTPDQEEFINNEVRRIDDGYWFFSNGVITYITGLHYFYLNYWVLEDGNPVKYRDADRKWFFFQDYCESKPYIYGILRGKFRRQGATSQACAALVRTAMRQRRAFNGIVSKTGDDARDAFRDMVMTAIRTMPMYIKPWIDNEEALTEVNFVKKATSKQRATKKKGQTAYQYRGLESKIQYKNTSLNAFDSGRKTMLLIDECGKWEEVPIHVYWGIVKKTMGQGAVRVGFCLMPTTVNKAKKGGENFKILWDSSDHNKQTTTPSGLYRYFCPADDGFEPFIDDYGMSIRGELTPTQKTSICTITGTEWWDAGGRTCADYIKYKTKQIDDDETRQEEIRMLPLSEAKMFEFGAVEAFLNTHNIHAQKDYLVHHPPTFRQIRFVRKDDGVVDFADDAAGPWKVLMLPKAGEINRSGFGDDGFKRPANTATYTISVDPMRNSGEAKYGSKGAAWVIKKPDATDPENSNMPVAMYLGRPRWKKHFYEQLFLAAEYYGCKINYESDIKDAEDYAFENGLKGYLRKRPKSTISPDRKFDEKFKKQYGTPSNDPFSFSKQLELLKVYFDSYCHLIYFYELLEDAEKFDPEDRTKRDLTVAFGIGLTDCVADVRPKSGANIKKIKLIRTFDLSQNGHL